MKKVYHIGRDQQNDIVINDNTDVVSRLHATLKFNGSKMFIIDQSQNGTYINGMRITMNEEVPVTRNDRVSFANVAELDWREVPKNGPDTKKLLSLLALIAAAVALIVAIVWAINHFSGKEEQKNGPEEKVEQPTDNNGLSTDNENVSGTEENAEDDSEANTEDDTTGDKKEEEGNTNNGRGGNTNGGGNNSGGTTNPGNNKEQPTTVDEVVNEPPTDAIPVY